MNPIPSNNTQSAGAPARPATLVNVTADNGIHGTIDTTAWPLDGSRPQVLVRLDDGRQFMAPRDVLTRQADGSYRLGLRGTDLDQLTAALGDRAREEVVVPVLAEDLDVSKRSVETGRVRLTKLVREEQQVIDQPLMREEVSVERVLVNRFVDAPVQPRQEGDVLVIPVLEEVVVVEKRLMLKEEVRVSKRVTEAREPQTVTLRSEEVRVDRLRVGRPEPAGGAGGAAGGTPLANGGHDETARPA